jgi:hypothetical protein
MLHQPLKGFRETSKSGIFLMTSIYLVDFLQFVWYVLKTPLYLFQFGSLCVILFLIIYAIIIVRLSSGPSLCLWVLFTDST